MFLLFSVASPSPLSNSLTDCASSPMIYAFDCLMSPGFVVILVEAQPPKNTEMKIRTAAITP